MALKLEIVSDHAELVGEDAQRVFSEEGGTIGRSLKNDWILPDPDRFISGSHATIDFKGGIYYLLDTSSNGVYINDEDEPIGKGNPRRLFNGDRLRMGDFEFAVAVDSGEDLELPPKPEPTVVPDHIEQLVDEDRPESSVKLLDEEEITGDDAFESALSTDADESAKQAAPAADGSKVRKRKRKRKSKNKLKARAAEKNKASGEKNTAAKDSDKRSPVKPPATNAVLSAFKRDENYKDSPDALFDALLEGLGISRVELHPSVDRADLMLTAGHMLREFVEGTVNLLAARASLKNAFRLDQTAILPRYNNPLKVSESPSDLIKQLLVGDEGDYLGARDAVHEACNDLLNHQNAFLDAMNSAFIEFADRFHPDELQNGFERTLGDNKLFSFKNKSKYWDLYRELYPIMTEKGGGRFPQMFGEEFVKAYERQVADYQRLERERHNEAASRLGDRSAALLSDGADLRATQSFDAPKVFRNASAVTEMEASNDTISETLAEALDHRFIEELDKSIAKEASRNQRKA